MVDLSHLQIEIWSLGRLLAYARNSRTHSDAQIAQIAASIKEFGWTSPILVGEGGVIIAGHARVLAARKLGMDEVPVIVLAHLTPAQRRALVLADNKLAMNAGWDEEMLRIELQDLDVGGFNLDLIGFSADELRLLLAADEPDELDADAEEEVPEPPAQPVTQPGDVWLIESHRLICGDCRDASVVAKLFEGRKANVVVTSPPYATQREYDPASGFRPVAPDAYVDWFRDVAANIATVLASDGSYFLLCGEPHNRKYAETMIMRSRRVPSADIRQKQ
jgi:hypothetical protein